MKLPGAGAEGCGEDKGAPVMKIHYLLLSDLLVPPALDGRKTQTRRIVAWSNSYVDGSISAFWRLHWHQLDFSLAVHRVYPRYQVGDRVVFKEKVRFLGIDMNRHGRTHHVEDAVVEYSDGVKRTVEVDWRIGEELISRGKRDGMGAWIEKQPWRSSRFMPAWAARLVCTITKVRVQRLQEITEEDAKAEGVSPCGEHISLCPDRCYRNEFAVLWNTINAKRGYSWESNPYVYAITFRREP